jgi:hypothetical protein
MENVELGLLVYGTEDSLVYLEIYSWDATPASLPLADTIGPFESPTERTARRDT